MVPYSKTKSQLIQHFNMVHPRDISLTKSKGSSRLLSIKGGVKFWFWALFFKIYLLRPTLDKFFSQGGRSRILMISISHTILVLLSCPLYISGVAIKKIQMSFLAHSDLWSFHSYTPISTLCFMSIVGGLLLARVRLELTTPRYKPPQSRIP